MVHLSTDGMSGESAPPAPQSPAEKLHPQSSLSGWGVETVGAEEEGESKSLREL